jgi:anti-sigma B factor antagonist
MTTPTRRRRLEVEIVGDVAIVNFVDRKLLEEQQIEEIGLQLFALVDEDGRLKILLNFANLEYVASAAFGKMITLQKKKLHNRGTLIICCVSPEVYEAFEITNLHKFFTIRKDEASALQAF